MRDAFTDGYNAALTILGWLTGALLPTAAILLILIALWWAYNAARHRAHVHRINRHATRDGRATSEERWAGAA